MKKNTLENYFLKGPIYLPWLSKAYKASPNGSSLAVYILLLTHYWLKHEEQPFKISKGFRQDFGIERHTFYRGLNSLEQVGLIQTIRISGRSIRIRIIGKFNVKSGGGSKSAS